MSAATLMAQDAWVVEPTIALPAVDAVPTIPAMPSFAPRIAGPVFAFQAPARTARESRSRTDESYRKGVAALDRRDYEGSINFFRAVIDEKGPRADGAYYWQAYALNKLGRRNEAEAALTELRKSYPNSSWLQDAQALDLEVRRNNGQRVAPEAASDDDLKLLALNSLMGSEPERTIPLLEKLLKSSNPPRIKERALFVLAQSGSPKARELMMQVARGNSNPDLQLKAVEYLGVFGSKENRTALAEIYKSSGDSQLKRSILRSFLVCGCRDELFTAAKGETNPEVRVEAIRQLGVMGASDDLMQLYTPDQSYEVRRAILNGLLIAGNADKVIEIARVEKDPKMRLEAIRQLGPMGGPKAQAALTSFYAKESDQHVKREIINALFIQANATPIIEIARKETDPNLKREAVQKLSIMHSKEATDFLMELINK